jgi:DNA-binding LytR/AlgR family response regulator
MERCKISDIEELLDSRFLRCHQSYIINMDEVKEINTSFLMFSGNTVPIRRKDFAKIRNEFEEYTTFK